MLSISKFCIHVDVRGKAAHSFQQLLGAQVDVADFHLLMAEMFWVFSCKPFWEMHIDFCYIWCNLRTKEMVVHCLNKIWRCNCVSNSRVVCWRFYWKTVVDWEKGPILQTSLEAKIDFVDFHFLSCLKIWGTWINVFMLCAVRTWGNTFIPAFCCLPTMFLFSIALHGEIDVSTCQWQGALLSSNRDERIDVCDFCKRGKVFCFLLMDGRLGTENWIETLVHSGKWHGSTQNSRHINLWMWFSLAEFQTLFQNHNRKLFSSHDNSWKTNALASNDVVLASRQLASKLQA